MSKEEAEYHHREERLNDGPGGAQRSLFIAYLDVAPDEEIKQLAVFPKLVELERDPAA